jgi:phosphoglycerate dehydrogenase-like enzyme
VVIDESDESGFRAAMIDAEALLHVLEPVTAKHIAEAPKLRLIQKIGVGVNTIDLSAAKARDVIVANMPGTNSQAVAEMTLNLMLTALRRTVVLDRAVRNGTGWGLPPDAFDRTGEICGRVVGLVGFGEVPRRLAPALSALGARVIHHCLPQTDDRDWRTLDALFAESDIVSLHIPLTPQTEDIINARTLAQMRPGVVLINTARGGLVDEAALADALRSGHVRAAGLDVLALEPAVTNHPFFALDNVVMTPHVAWLTPETLERSLTIAIENIRRVRDGEPVLHRV